MYNLRKRDICCAILLDVRETIMFLNDLYCLCYLFWLNFHQNWENRVSVSIVGVVRIISIKFASVITTKNFKSNICKAKVFNLISRKQWIIRLYISLLLTLLIIFVKIM